MFSRRRFVYLAVALSGCSPNPSYTPAEQADVQAPGPQGIEGQLFKAVNVVRRREGVPELRWLSSAAAAAESHSRAMAQRGFFSHTDPQRGDLAARIKKAGVQWSLIAENLFQQRGCPDAVRCAVEGWLESAGHRRNLLNAKYTHTGIGVSSDERKTLYYTQIFVTP
jgi:uncharacterized protein YkwD